MQACSSWPKTFCSIGTRRTPTEKGNGVDKMIYISLIIKNNERMYRQTNICIEKQSVSIKIKHLNPTLAVFTNLLIISPVAADLLL